MNMRQVEHKHTWKEGSADHDYMPFWDLTRGNRGKHSVWYWFLIQPGITQSFMTCNLSEARHFSLTLKVWMLWNRKLHEKLCCFFPGWWATACLSSDSVCARVDLEVESLGCRHSFSHLPFRAWCKDPGVQGSIWEAVKGRWGLVCRGVLLWRLESRARETVFP